MTSIFWHCVNVKYGTVQENLAPGMSLFTLMLSGTDTSVPTLFRTLEGPCFCVLQLQLFLYKSLMRVTWVIPSCVLQFGEYL